MRLRLYMWPMLILIAAGLSAAWPMDHVIAASDGDGAQDQDPVAPDDSSGDFLRIPGMPPMQLPPGVHVYGSDGQELFGPMQGRGGEIPGLASRKRPTNPSSASPEERAKAAKAEALKKAVMPHPTHAALRSLTLDKLFKRLATAGDADEAAGIAAAIDHVWMQSESDTATLLMARALAAQQAGHLPLALTLFDRLLSLEPGWAEAWDKRATTRFLGDDLAGAMTDLEQTLRLEPRHFSALVAMGFIYEKQGQDKRALEAFRKALALNPQQPEVQSIVDKLQVEVEGRDI